MRRHLPRLRDASGDTIRAATWKTYGRRDAFSSGILRAVSSSRLALRHTTYKIMSIRTRVRAQATATDFGGPPWDTKTAYQKGREMTPMASDLLGN